MSAEASTAACRAANGQHPTRGISSLVLTKAPANTLFFVFCRARNEQSTHTSTAPTQATKDLRPVFRRRRCLDSGPMAEPSSSSRAHHLRPHMNSGSAPIIVNRRGPRSGPLTQRSLRPPPPAQANEWRASSWLTFTRPAPAHAILGTGRSSAELRARCRRRHDGDRPGRRSRRRRGRVRRSHGGTRARCGSRRRGF